MTNTTTKEQATPLYSKDFETDHLSPKPRKIADALRRLFVGSWANEEFPLHNGGCQAFREEDGRLWVCYDGGILFDMLSPNGDGAYMFPEDVSRSWVKIDHVLGRFGFFAEERNSWSFDLQEK